MQVLQNPQILSRKSNNNAADQLILTNKNSHKSMGMGSPVMNSNMKSPQQPGTIKFSRMSEPQPSYCTKHNQRQSNYHPNNDDSQFSIDSQYLRQEAPLSLQIQPEIQIQVKPNIDILISTNLRVNKYKQTYERLQKQQFLQNKNQQLKKLQQSAKQALLRTKSQKQPHQNKWGHSIYSKQTPQLKEKPETSHKPVVHSPQSKKENLQNAAQKAKKRIAEFKQKQFEKQKQQKKQQNLQKQIKLDEKKLSEVNTKIVQNAAQILRQKQAQIQEAKRKKQEIKRKISQLQKQSLNNCKKSRQNPLKIEEGKQEQFHLQSSQYSTFQARKQGRKMVKKQKKKKNIQQKQQNQQSKVVAKTNSRRFLKDKMTKTAPNFNKTKKSQKQKQNIDNQQRKQNDQQQQQSNKEYKRFYVWNVPIKQQDFSVIALNKRLEQQKVLQNQRKKQSKKSFKDQADQYLRQKQLMKLQSVRQKSRKQLIQMKIAQKKQQFIRQYEEMYEHNNVVA